MKIQTVTAVVNVSSLRHNLQRIRNLIPAHSRIIAILKANAYGHGLTKIANILSDVDIFGVSRLEEAFQISEENLSPKILLLEGFISEEDLYIVSEKGFQTTIYNIQQLKILETAHISQPITVWMKLDVGIHRLGVRLEQAELFYKRLMLCKNIKKPINIMSHFSHADELECNITSHQLNIFNNFCSNKPGLRSIAASSGILFWPKSHFNYVRPGIILYGISPLYSQKDGIEFGFQPAMSLMSRLISIREYKSGESVGYGGVWIGKDNSFLGVVSIGYGDGYPRSVPFGTPVVINGRKVKIVGRIAMDTMCIDLGSEKKDQIGDIVTLWGNNILPVEKVSRKIGVSAYELVTSLTSRVKMLYF